MLTIGAPASSTEARHSATLNFSLIVCEYSRMRPQPVQVRLQACSGSSISTSGKRLAPVSFFFTMYAAIDSVRLRGKRMKNSSGERRFAEASGRFREASLSGGHESTQRHQREVQRVQV